MTKEDQEDRHECRVAALLAVHLVSQVLDEAYVIANAARESGEPWLYISMLKKLRNDDSFDTQNDTSLVATKGDSDVNENKMELVANVIATSTPQKTTGDKTYTTEPNFIGQGDEELELEQGHLMKSTSVFINNLFDMSEVEHVIFCDDNLNAKPTMESNELLTQAMSKIMDSYINTALGIAFEQHPVNYGHQVSEAPSSSTEYTDYSFLADAIPSDLAKDIGFCVQENICCQNEECGDAIEITAVDTAEVSPKIEEKSYDNISKQSEVAFYENTYLTLNRDYDQYSEDGDPILQDPKELALQEIELMTANTSDQNLLHGLEDDKKVKEPVAEPAEELGTVVSRKSSLVRRCRDQGAKLLARLRGWWRRKTPGKHKEPRVSAVITGMCPLSPDARRRAASLLDQRAFRSPSPSRPAVWKFNTVNEALVNSSRWKDYTFDVMADD